MQAGLPATYDCVAAFSETDFRQDLSAVDVPTLLVHGAADRLAPVEATARRAAELIATSELTVIDAAPHGLWFTHKEQVNALLLEFPGPVSVV
jgi:non-heme chloroperoxidase